MVKTIEISDEAYSVIMTHAHENNESTKWAVDELVNSADTPWVMEFPEMKKVWAKFKEYYRSLPAFEGME
jgi:hypothetical protein